MKLNLKALTLALVLATVTGVATVRVFAQDEKTQEAEKKQDEKQDEKDEDKKPEPAQWATIPDTGFKIGFAKDWQLSGKKIKQGRSADNQVGISAYVALQPTAKEAVAHLSELLGEQIEGLMLTDPTEERECHGLKVLSTGGHGKAKGDDPRNLDVAVDVVEIDGKVIMVMMMGVHEFMDKHAADIILAQESYQKDKK